MPFINRMRLSFVWNQTFPLDAPTSFLGNRQRYHVEFEKAKQAAIMGIPPEKVDLLLPWPKQNPYNHFWQYHLERRDLTNVTVNQAWNHLMPLRSSQRLSVRKVSQKTGAVAEGFFFPIGAGVVLSLYFQEGLPLDDMVDKIVEVCSSSHQVKWLKDGKKAKLSIDTLASQLLLDLHMTALDQTAPSLPPLEKPFSVVTVIDATDSDKNKPVEVGDAMHRALEGLCTLSPHWRDTPLHDLEYATRFEFMHKGFLPKGYLQYGLRRSLVTWYPGFFTEHLDEGEKLNSLACYHRNLTLLILQTSILISLVRQVAGLLHTREPIPDHFKEPARKAAGILGRLYGGDLHGAYLGRYKAWVSRELIKEHLKEINAVRAAADLGPLATP